MRRLRCFPWTALISFSLSILPVGSANGQPVFSRLSGIVLDSSTAPVAGARVAVVPVSQGPRQSTVTDSRGAFSFSLANGVYVLTIAADGFVALSQPVTVSGPEPAPREFILQVAGVQETVEVSAPAVYREDSTTSATRTPTVLRDIPQSITVINRTFIDDQRMTTMADAVRYVPGIGMAQGEGNRDTPIFRGNSSTSDFFVDGVRDDVQYFRDLYNIERVEALKGPNAMIFGRGGAGGVLNRVSRQAIWAPTREFVFQGGSYENRRITGDVGQGLTSTVAARVTGVYERSNSYRRGVGLERFGINPTVAFMLGERTTLKAGYEFFHDERTADRGISSFQGRPVATDRSTFFGDPDLSTSDVTANVVVGVLDHRFGPRASIRSRASYGDYDKFYQNVFPGAVNAAGTSVSISAYNNATVRRNLFSQTDLTVTQQTGPVGHTILGGAELGRQVTDNVRRTGYFHTVSPTTTSVSVALENPVTSQPVDFRPSPTDADNHGIASVAAIYAQDQITLSKHVQAVLGLRYESFQVDFRNNRTDGEFTTEDGLVSPRASLIYKPVAPMSIYGSYTVAYLPRAGEQLSSLQLSNQALDPEEFRNYEIGAKWDVTPALSFTAAAYRLDRGNVLVPDPDDPTLSLLVDAQRTKGVELGVSGVIMNGWSLAGGYTYQDGLITRSLSSTVQAGAVLAQLPRHSFSLWNKVDVARGWAAALGIVSRSDMFASTDNTVTLSGYTRVDAAVYYSIARGIRAQVNVENLFDEHYFGSAHSNTNITPGSPRAVRISLTTRF